jgi:hypothetical protein
MFRRHHLGKRLWLGAIGLMTSRAQYCGIGKFWNHRSGVFGVPGKWAVTGFATEPGVLTFGFDFRLFRVTGLASLTAGEFNLSRANVVHSARPEVPVFAELRWDHHPTDCQERNDSQSQKYCDTD